MLVSFSVSNYMSFKELIKFSMVAMPFKEHESTHVIQVNNKLRLLKSAVIFGDNASGKTNLFNAIGFMIRLVLNSYRDALMTRAINLDKFAFNTEMENKPSFFEVVFIHEGIRYRYNFEINEGKITSEQLYHTTSKEVYLFKRDHLNFEINKESFKEGIGKEGEVKENVLFLSKLATDAKEISSKVLGWFLNVGFTTGLADIHSAYTLNKLKTDKKFHDWVSLFVKYLEISGISIVEEEVQGIEFIIKKGENNETFNKANTRLDKRLKIETLHRKYDENNLLIDTVSFSLNKESEGTKKLIYLLGPLYDALMNGKLLIIDELDSRLHGLLVLRIIEFFHICNKKNAQLIGISHNTSLLDKDTLRRDQVWFVEKNQFGESELVSLGDFKTNLVRKTSDYAKMYLKGKFVAIPDFDSINDELNTIMYGE